MAHRDRHQLSAGAATPLTDPPFSRRRFLHLALSGAAVAASVSSFGCVPDGPALPEWPFTLGVASGDPLADRVVLWTRLAPDPLAGGGMPPAPVPVVWEVAEDEGFRRVVRAGVAVADPSLAHSVHVDVNGLRPASWYWYRFRAGPHVSDVGRTRTLPAPGDAPGLVRFATASCQSFTSGYYTAYAHMAQEDLDFVVFLGDYIYESGATGPVRSHQGPRLHSLADYRARHALYKSDPNLQAAHRRFPWVITWDDHEVQNNYAALAPDAYPSPQEMPAVRQAAYHAWYEHMPVRVLPPKDPFLKIYRRFEVGDLMSLSVLDTRQYRTDQPCGDGLQAACAGFPDPQGTLLGDAQEGWLLDGLGRSPAIWNVVAQQVVFSPALIGSLRNMDQWDGYPLARQRILDFVRQQDVRNFVVLTGDIHASGAGTVPASETDLATAIGSEFVATGIASTFPADLADLAETVLGGLPHVAYFDARRRGYVRHEVSRSAWRADFRLVDTTLQPTSPIQTAASFSVADGAPGPQPA